ncbi:hypothetical protein HN784_05090 [bacterium]|jgi:hypothetical protein|nr:hypothetical protein [bacterium]MBT4250729.1 hypothetical protein [bacterium]MBT4598188.1 hypothetical protein [bacterium]MBT6753786.1 hypothetical protein [bacterium]MBT7037501.1 hypothetical protein [bacterium]
MTITPREFKSAQIGDALIDCHERRFRIISLLDGIFYPTMVHSNEFGTEKLCLMEDKIVEKEFATFLVDLNHKDARFITKQ